MNYVESLRRIAEIETLEGAQDLTAREEEELMYELDDLQGYVAQCEGEAHAEELAYDDIDYEDIYYYHGGPDGSGI